MSIKLNDSIRVEGGKPVEDKRLNNGMPWDSVEQVNASIPITDRYLSLEVLIGDTLYWYKNSTEDYGLVVRDLSSTHTEEIYTHVLKIETDINTSYLINGFNQRGKNIVSVSSENIVVTIDEVDGFCASYQKGSTGNIIFQVASNNALIQVDDTNVIDGAKGSTATVTIIDNEALLRIANK